MEMLQERCYFLLRCQKLVLIQEILVKVTELKLRTHYGVSKAFLQSYNYVQGEDEQMIADIAASILRRKPLPVSTELLDSLYDSTTEAFQQLEEALAVYKADKLAYEIKTTFSVLRETIEAYNP